ncbi:MAG: lipoyl domain-containing protein, partial [Acidimicrobiales bacterium]
MADILMPRLSDTMEEGKVTRWLKHPGDTVARGEVIGEIETDKATMDLEVYEDGVLQSLLVEEGTTVPIGRPIAVVGNGPGSPAPPEATEAAASDGGAPQAPARDGGAAPGGGTGGAPADGGS